MIPFSFCIRAFATFLVIFIGWNSVDAATFKVRWDSPGSGGMVSDVDPSLLEPHQSPLLKNMNIRTHGFLLPRNNLAQLTNFNVFKLYGAYGYYNNLNGTNNIVGVNDSVYVWFNTNAAHDDTVVVPTLVGQIFITDTLNGDSAWHGVRGHAFPTSNTTHRWAQYKDLLIHVDGKSSPQILTTSQGFIVDDSIPDTIGYQPRLISLGLEAPGQLRVGVTERGGELYGRYQYAYSFLDTTDTDSASGLSLWSSLVYLDYEYPYLTGFESDISTKGDLILVVRKKIDGAAVPYVIDTLFPIQSADSSKASVFKPVTHADPNYAKSNYTYSIKLGVDGGSDIATAVFAVTTTVPLITVTGSLADTINTTFLSSITDSVEATAVGNELHIVTTKGREYSIEVDSLSIVESWFDSAVGSQLPIVYKDTLSDALCRTNQSQWGALPIDTAMHRPGQFWSAVGASGWTGIGGGTHDTSLDVSNTDHAMADSIYSIAYSYLDPITGIESPRGPTKMLMIDSLFEGATPDTNCLRIVYTGTPSPDRPKWIRLWQGIKQSSLFGGGDTTVWYALYDLRTDSTSQGVVYGNWTDLSVATGLDTSTLSKPVVYDYQVVRNIYGEPVVRPPYIYDLQIPFSDVAIFGNRAWGVGDPECPACIYWSKIDTIFSWHPLDYNYIEDAGDKIVALEVANNALYAFKRNSVYKLIGDPQYNWSFEKVVNGVGSISRKATVQYLDDIYFMSPNKKIYSVNKGEISTPVYSYIDTSLFSSGDMKKHSNAMIFDGLVKFFNDSTGRSLSFDPDKGTWILESYGSYEPSGSFIFDTLSSDGIGDAFTVVYSDTTDRLRSTNLSKSFDWDVQDDTLFAPGVEWWSPTIRGQGDLITVQNVKFNYMHRLLGTAFRFYITVYSDRFDSLSTDSIRFDSSGAIGPSAMSTSVMKKIEITPSNPQSGIILKFWSPDYDPQSFGFRIAYIHAIEATFREHGMIEYE